MKRCLLILTLLWTALYAQIQVLPDIEVSGESQIKIHLYKKALPYSRESIARDSIMAFVPSSLPQLDLPQRDPTPKSFRHYLNLQGDSRWGGDAVYKYYPASSWLNDAKARLSMRFPKKEMHSHHLFLGLDFGVEEGDAFGLALSHFDTEMKGLDSEYTMATVTSYLSKVDIMKLKIRQMSNELRGYRIEQDNGGTTFEGDGLGFTHQSLMDFENFTWRNRLYLYAKKQMVHSFVEVQQDKIDKFGIHVIHDGYSFFAVPGFHFRHITDYDQEFSIINQPETERNDFCELLETYRWLSFDSSRRNTTIPLNLKIALERSHKSFFIDRYLLTNSTKYKVNAPTLKDSPNPDVPELYYADVFSNESGVLLGFGQGKVTFEQALLINLSYMPGEDWVQEPYAPLLKVESALVYKGHPFEASLGFNQHYFAKDHDQDSLPELFDLSVKAACDLSIRTQIYLRAENLLNSPKWQFKSLPRQDTSYYAGFVQRF